MRRVERARGILSYLTRVRTLDHPSRINPDFDGAPAEAPRGYQPWFRAPAPAWADHVPVFGHWAALGLDLGPGHLGLDSGCVWGRHLSAVRLDDRALFQVKAVEAEQALGGRPSPRNLPPHSNTLRHHLSGPPDAPVRNRPAPGHAGHSPPAFPPGYTTPLSATSPLFTSSRP